MCEPAKSSETPDARCPLCGGARTHLRSTHPDFSGTNIRRCGECDFDFGHPPPTATVLEKYYRETYGRRRTWSAAPAYLTLMQRRAAAQRSFFAEQLPGIRSAVDIGCGVGALVAELSGAGVRALGYDSDETVIQVGRARLGADIRQGHVSGEGEGAAFDLLCLSHVVEHFSNPVVELRTLAGQVRPGGLVFIEVPNCIPWMFTEQVATESHLGFYTSSALRRLAGACELEVVRLENCGPPIVEYYLASRKWLASMRQRGWGRRVAQGLVRRARAAMARLAPTHWPVQTEFDSFFDVYYPPSDERGLWLRALLRKPPD